MHYKFNGIWSGNAIFAQQGLALWRVSEIKNE
jgi:hypothetical protein